MKNILSLDLPVSEIICWIFIRMIVAGLSIHFSLWKLTSRCAPDGGFDNLFGKRYTATNQLSGPLTINNFTNYSVYLDHWYNQRLILDIRPYHCRCHAGDITVEDLFPTYPKKAFSTWIFNMTELTRTLPASWYCNESLYQMERRAVFVKVCCSSKIVLHKLSNLSVLVSSRTGDPISGCGRASWLWGCTASNLCCSHFWRWPESNSWWAESLLCQDGISKTY